jgi:hypothetical protein
MADASVLASANHRAHATVCHRLVVGFVVRTSVGLMPSEPRGVPKCGAYRAVTVVRAKTTASDSPTRRVWLIVSRLNGMRGAPRVACVSGQFVTDYGQNLHLRAADTQRATAGTRPLGRTDSQFVGTNRTNW